MKHENELPELLQHMTTEERAEFDEIIAGADPAMQILEALRTCTLEELVAGEAKADEHGGGN